MHSKRKKGDGIMKIYFVRHGHPDYKNDCLTEIGHRQALAAAERLKDCDIKEIYASTKGRAMQTAEYTAKQYGLEIVPCDFMREIGWKSIDERPLPKDGHPWNLSKYMAANGVGIFDRDWQDKEPYCRSEMVKYTNAVAEGIDAWLAELGYQREGNYYRVVGENTNKTVAMFSHAGSSAAAISHMVNIPFPQFCGVFRTGFTSITMVKLSDEVGALCYPSIHLSNDVRHTDGISAENVISN